MTNTSTESLLLVLPDIKAGTTQRPVDGHLSARPLSCITVRIWEALRDSRVGRRAPDGLEPSSATAVPDAAVR